MAKRSATKKSTTKPVAKRSTTRSPKATVKKEAKQPEFDSSKTRLRNIKTATRTSLTRYLKYRPHRSFRRTRRRDYIRSLEIPGYIAFTYQVWAHLMKHKRVFGGLIACYALATIVLVGAASQETFTQLAGLLKETSGSILEGGWGEIGKAGLLLFSGAVGNFSPQLGETQQIYAALLFTLTWLAGVWLMRAQVAGGKPRLRDALYNSGAPIVSTAIVALLIVVQMLPMAIGVIGYTTALSAELAGVLAMVVFLAAFLLIALSLYLVTSSFFALIVCTLPGMYPLEALRTAAQLVINRRLRILLRMVWLIVVVLLAWVLAMLPIILFATWLQSTWPQISWVPIVPFALSFTAAASTVFASSYTYMLYRKVVDNDSSAK